MKKRISNLKNGKSYSVVENLVKMSNDFKI